MKVRPLALLLFASVSPLTGATVNDRVDRLETQVCELQILLNQIRKRSPNQDLFNRQNSTSNGGYVVQSGDSYWTIARNLGVSLSALQNANPGINPRRLAIGKQINVPGGSRSASTPIRSSQTSTGGWTSTYQVREGDILGRIAENHGIRLHQLMSANPGLDPRRLRIGKTLNIPGQQKKTTSAPPVVRKRASIPDSPPAPVTSPEPVRRETPSTRSTQSAISSQRSQGVETRRNPYLSSRSEPIVNRAMGSFSERRAPEPRLVPVARDSRLAEIAQLHNTTVARINELNDVELSSEQMIRSGSQLYIPGR